MTLCNWLYYCPDISPLSAFYSAPHHSQGWEPGDWWISSLQMMMLLSWTDWFSVWEIIYLMLHCSIIWSNWWCQVSMPYFEPASNFILFKYFQDKQWPSHFLLDYCLRWFSTDCMHLCWSKSKRIYYAERTEGRQSCNIGSVTLGWSRL